jgi:hypothetical protein
MVTWGQTRRVFCEVSAHISGHHVSNCWSEHRMNLALPSAAVRYNPTSVAHVWWADPRQGNPALPYISWQQGRHLHDGSTSATETKHFRICRTAILHPSKPRGHEGFASGAGEWNYVSNLLALFESMAVIIVCMYSYKRCGRNQLWIACN